MKCQLSLQSCLRKPLIKFCLNLFFSLYRQNVSTQFLLFRSNRTHCPLFVLGKKNCCKESQVVELAKFCSQKFNNFLCIGNFQKIFYLIYQFFTIISKCCAEFASCLLNYHFLKISISEL